jgi:hypothetical protein
MSRPKINEQDKRVVQVNIRLTTEESTKVNGYAMACGLSPANWIRQKAFTGKDPPVRMTPLDASIYQELKRIGVNLNQATHKLNRSLKSITGSDLIIRKESSTPRFVLRILKLNYFLLSGILSAVIMAIIRGLR